MALSKTASNVIDEVATQSVGYAPILRYYFEKCAIAKIIDQNVPTDLRRKVLTHGEASVAMITGILFQIMQLYRIQQFAEKTTVLNVIYPKIMPEEYFDDRLADTLDALYEYGLGDLEIDLTRYMIDTFEIINDICHNDTTSASYYGKGNHNRDPNNIKLTFGHSKKHRNDLKQLVWSMSVSSDSAFPLFQQPYCGNTADVNTYVEQWHHLIDLLGHRDFLFVGDCKVISKENVAAICDNDGFFLAPAPKYKCYMEIFEEALREHTSELLIPYKDRINRGFEVPMNINHNDKNYHLRMIILFDHGLGRLKRNGIDDRIEKTKAAFAELDGKLNRRKLKTHDAIDKACKAILKKHKTTSFFTYEIINNPVVTYKNKRRGRPSKNKPVEKIEVRTDKFHVQLCFDPKSYEKAIDQCGYYPLVTNRSMEDLSIEEAMLAHKKQYKSEHTFRRAKGAYDLEPIYLHYNRRIEAYLFLFKIALQILVLIERTSRQNIHKRDQGLDDFMPNRKDVRNPRAEYLLGEFQYIIAGLITMPDGRMHGFVSKLSDTQLDILAVLEVPAFVYSYQYLFDSS